MRNSWVVGSCLLFIAVLAVGPTRARAQAPASSTPPQPAAAAPEALPPSAAAEAAPAPVPAAQAPAAMAQVVPARTQAQCLLGPSRGVAEPDAMTAAGLVCEALRENGANLETTPRTTAAADATSAYRVELMPLGTILMLNVAFESPIGTRVETRSLQLARLEEIPVAAPRIAKSLLDGEPLEKTAKMNTLIGAETLSYQKKYGEIVVGLGVFGFGAFNTNVSTGYGIYGQLYYEVLEYALGAQLRLGGSGGNMGDASLTDIAIGGRYFFSDGDITPFLGGGFGVMWFEHIDDHRINPAPVTDAYFYDNDGYYGDYRHYEGSGAAVHAEVGVEFLRMHDVRFDIVLRVDAPLFQLNNDNSTGSDKYIVPLSLMGSFSFQ